MSVFAATIQQIRDQTEARRYLENNVAKISGGLPISDLAPLLGSIREESERLSALENIAVHIVSLPNDRPVTAMQINSILLMFNGKNKEKANKILQDRLETIQTEQQTIGTNEND